MHCGLSVIQDSPGTSKPNKIQTRIIIHLLKLCIYKCERSKTHVLGLRGKAERRKRHVKHLIVSRVIFTVGTSGWATPTAAKLPLSFRTLSIYLWFEDLCAWNIQIWEGSKVGDIRRMRYKPTTRVRLDFAESGGQGIGASFIGFPATSTVSGSDCTPNGIFSPSKRSEGVVLPALEGRISCYESIASPGKPRTWREVGRVVDPAGGQIDVEIMWILITRLRGNGKVREQKDIMKWSKWARNMEDQQRDLRGKYVEYVLYIHRTTQL